MNLTQSTKPILGEQKPNGRKNSNLAGQRKTQTQKVKKKERKGREVKRK